MIFPVLVLVCVGLFFYLLLRPCFRPPNFPSGPVCLPILGGLPVVFACYGGDMLAFIKAMKARYGKIFSFNMGMDRVVVISDFDTLKEISNKDEFIWRPSMGAIGDSRFPDENGHWAGIMFNDGPMWKEQRRFSLKILRDMGMGKRSMEALMQEEVRMAVDNIQETYLNKSVSLKSQFSIYALNSLWKIVSGEKLTYHNPKLQNIVCKIHNLLTCISQVGAIQLFSWLKYLAPDASGYTTVNSALLDVLGLVEETCKAHEDVWDNTDEEPRDYIDGYLKKIKLADDGVESESSFLGRRGHENLRSTIMDFFIAGSDTTSSTLDWAVMWLCGRPEVQRRAQKEIDAVIGRDRLPCLDDRPHMPYIESLIQEVHRASALSYLGIPRQVPKDVKIGSYDIPKGTRVFMDLYSVMHDPDYWKNPGEFRPERFLDEEGRYKPDERCVPFGMGKRNCMGKSLAQNQLFLFLSGFLQSFDFSFPDGESAAPQDTSTAYGFLRSCPEYRVVITAR